MDLLTLTIVIAAAALVLLYLGAVTIKEDEIGLVVKKFSLNPLHSSLPIGRSVATKGEPGWQAQILTPGFKWRLPGIYKIVKSPVIRIEQGEIALIEAEDGDEPQKGSFPKAVQCKNFQDAKQFLEKGGQKGIQMDILTAGTYRINTKLFTVITKANASQHGINPNLLKEIRIESDEIGIVTVWEGKSLPKGELDISVAPKVEGHNSFQDLESFFANGGCKGLQEEVLEAASYRLNPKFVTIEKVPPTQIKPGTVGVVIAHYGKVPEDKGTNLVEKGYQGIWREALTPKTYVINPKIMDIEIVPTHHITLEWKDEKKDASRYDAELKALSLRSKDKFKFKVELTQTIEINPESAPKLIQKMGISKKLAVANSPENHDDENDSEIPDTDRYESIKSFVYRFLAPAVSAYFRNAAQEYDVLDFHLNRAERQRDAEEQIGKALKQFGVISVATVINEIDLPDDLEPFVKEQTLANEERKGLEEKRLAEVERTKLKKQIAITEMTQKLVEKEYEVTIREHETKAEKLKLKMDSDRIREMGKAEAEAEREKVMVIAEGLKAEAEAIGRENYTDIQKAKELAKMALPETFVTSGGNSGGTGMIDAITGQMLGNGHKRGKFDKMQLLALLESHKSNEVVQRILLKLENLPASSNSGETEFVEVIEEISKLGLLPPESNNTPSESEILKALDNITKKRLKPGK